MIHLPRCDCTCLKPCTVSGMESTPSQSWTSALKIEVETNAAVLFMLATIAIIIVIVIDFLID